jgi:hypothetical protein
MPVIGYAKIQIRRCQMKVRRTLIGVMMAGAFLTCFALGVAHAQGVPDLSIWKNTWFKVTFTSTVYHFSNIGVKPTPGYAISESAGISYMKIIDWDTTTTPEHPFLVVDVYAKDSGNWIPVDTVNIYYFAGSNLKFVGSAEVGDPTTSTPGTSLTLLFVFKGKRNAANTKFIMDGSTKLSTMGSAIFEIDDFPGSTERWAGAAKLSGPMVPVSKLPPPLQGL